MKKIATTLFAILFGSVTSFAAPTQSVQWGYDPTAVYGIQYKIGAVWFPLATSIVPDAIYSNDYVKDLTGATDVSSQLNAAFQAAHDQKKKLIIVPGTYSLGSRVGISVTNDMNISCDSGASLVARAGFPSGQKMVQFTGLDNVKFHWSGCYFDASNVPNSLPGQANDAFGLNAGSSGADQIILENMDLYAGPDQLHSGSDSAIFAAWGRSMVFNNIHTTGFPDAAMYISGDSSGTPGTRLASDIVYDNLRFDGCFAGFQIKRQFRRVQGGRMFVNNCTYGLSLGAEAEINGVIQLIAGEAEIDSIIETNTEYPANIRYIDNVHINSVISKDSGYNYGGSSFSTTNYGIYLQGAQHTVVDSLIMDGTNPLNAGSTTTGVRLDPRTINAVTKYSYYNSFNGITAKNIDSYISEGATSNYNSFVILPSEGMSSVVPYKTGAQSTVKFTKSENGRLSLVSPTTTINGFSTESTMYIETASNQVNGFDVIGSASGSATGPVFASSGGDTNVPMAIVTKGTSNLYIQGAAGDEVLRIPRGSTGTSALELIPDPSGAFITLQARNGGTNINLNLSPKGSGVVSVPGGSFQIGSPSTGASPKTGSLILQNSASQYASKIQSGNNTTQDTTYVLPTDYGSPSGSVLYDAAGNGVLSWNPIGQLVSTSVDEGSAVSISNGASKTIMSLSLSAGSWGCYTELATKPDLTTVQNNILAAVSSVDNTLPSIGSGVIRYPFTATAGIREIVQVQRTFDLESTTTVYSVISVGFSGGSNAAFGSFQCRRLK